MTNLAVVPPLTEYSECPFPAREGKERKNGTVSVYDSPTTVLRIYHVDGRRELRCKACGWVGDKSEAVASHWGKTIDGQHPVVTPTAKADRAARRRPMKVDEYNELIGKEMAEAEIAVEEPSPDPDFTMMDFGTVPRRPVAPPEPPVTDQENSVSLQGDTLAALRAALDVDGAQAALRTRVAELELELAQQSQEAQRAKAQILELQSALRVARESALNLASSLGVEQ